MAAYVNRGDAYQLKGEYDRAIQDFDQVLQINPSLEEAYRGRGMAYADKGEYEHARRDLNKALALGYDRAEIGALLEKLP